MTFGRSSAIFLALTAVLASSALAQLRPPERTLPPVHDTAETIVDRGALLEILPTHRSVPLSDEKGVHWRISSDKAAGDPLGTNAFGVLFNHSMQQFGYFNGEIVFKLKHGPLVGTITSAPRAVLKLITQPNIYAIYTKSPREFLRTLKELHGHPELQWVEPTVHYVGINEAPK